MKKILLPIIAATIVVSCGTDDEALKKKIQFKKNQIVKLEQQIADIEKELVDTLDNIRLIPVEVKEMQPEEFNHYIIVYGRVDADNYANISPEMNGKIKQMHVSEGQNVSKGQLLISLNTAAVEGQINAIKSNLDLAEQTFQKQDVLWKQGIGSEIQYLQSKSQVDALKAQLDAFEAQMRMAQIRAPFNGTVNKIYPKVGEMAGPGFPVMEFVNLDKVTIMADISESYIGHVKEGNIVEVSFASLPDIKISRPIVRTSKVINNVNRTFEIELNFKNPKKQIKPNMISTIHINDFKAENALVVPSLAIRKDISGNYVYIAMKEDGTYIVAKKYIKTKKSYDDQTMVEGLDIGDKVITKGFQLVSNGIPVKVVNN